MSEDPLGFAAGDANVSRYVGNGVTNFTDPSGLKPRKRKDAEENAEDNTDLTPETILARLRKNMAERSHLPVLDRYYDATKNDDNINALPTDTEREEAAQIDPRAWYLWTKEDMERHFNEEQAYTNETHKQLLDRYRSDLDTMLLKEQQSQEYLQRKKRNTLKEMEPSPGIVDTINKIDGLLKHAHQDAINKHNEHLERNVKKEIPKDASPQERRDIEARNDQIEGRKIRQIVGNENVHPGRKAKDYVIEYYDGTQTTISYSPDGRMYANQTVTPSRGDATLRKMVEAERKRLIQENGKLEEMVKTMSAENLQAWSEYLYQEWNTRTGNIKSLREGAYVYNRIDRQKAGGAQK